MRRVIIPKPGGGERPLGIPTIRDRVVQTAVKIVVEPVLEADLSPYTFGYRPKKSALDAIKVVQSMLNQGYTDVVDADLSKYFNTIPHDELLKSVAARISDRHILRLIKMWLKAPVEERTGDGGRRMSGGKNAKQGTPQGGVISPLLANRLTIPAKPPTDSGDNSPTHSGVIPPGGAGACWRWNLTVVLGGGQSSSVRL